MLIWPATPARSPAAGGESKERERRVSGAAGDERLQETNERRYRKAWMADLASTAARANTTRRGMPSVSGPQKYACRD